MKIIQRTLLLILFSAMTYQSQAAGTVGGGYELRFKIKGLKDTLCYLANYYGDKQYLKDSTKADMNGNVVFKGNEPLPGGIYLFVFPNKTYFEVLVDKQQKFSMECDQNDVINTMKVTNSEDNTLFYQYLLFIQQKSKEIEPLKNERKTLADAKHNTDEVDAKIKQIDKDVADYKTKFEVEHPQTLLAAIFRSSEEPVVPEAPLNPDGSKDSTFAYRYYKEHYFDKFDLADERILRTPVYNSRLSAYVKNLVIQMPDSLIKEADMLVAKAKPNKETFKYMIWYMTNTYETSNIMGLDEVFVHMVKKYYTKEIAYWVDDATLYKIQDRANILEPILLGKPVKNLTLADSNGVYQSVYNVKAPITVMYFWDPDCSHCKKVTPLVKAWYDKVHARGVEVFAACTEVEMDKWKKFINENKLNWINVADPKLQNNFRHEFDILTTPQIFVLDKDKKIIAKKIDEETLEKIVDKELIKLGR